MKKEKTIEDKYKKLDQITHVLLRNSRYIGSTKDTEKNSYVIKDNKMLSKKIIFNPGFLKLFDEIILNAVDESSRENSKLNTIKIFIDEKKKTIGVEDNGGIPVVLHKEHKEYVPEMIFGHLMAGSNFDDSDDRKVAGTHGEGATLTNIFSTRFKVETDDGKKHFQIEWKNNSREKSKPKITESKKPGTYIEYVLDEKFFTFTEDNIETLIKRTYDIAGCKPDLKIYLNGKQIKIKSFKDYIEFYTEDYLYEQNENFQIGIAKSETGEFENISFVNCIETYEGGTHVDYISNQIAVKIKEWIWKKKKYDIKPGEIKNHLRLFLNCIVINPSFSSQTKERLVTEQKNFKTSIELSDKFINSIIKSEIIQSILDWIDTKEKQKELAELRKLNKEIGKDNPKRIVKLSDASSTTERDKCALCIVEGLSASLAITSARDPKYIGSYALKGKIMNVSEVENKKLIENQEIREMMTAIGLKIGEPVKSIKDLRYGKIAVLTDADCLHEDTIIVTNRGNKSLKNIEIGDKALTSSGKFQDITRVTEKRTKEFLFLTIEGKIFKCTREHKFYVFDSIKDKVLIKKAVDINKETDFFLKKKKNNP